MRERRTEGREKGGRGERRGKEEIYVHCTTKVDRT